MLRVGRFCPTGAFRAPAIGGGGELGKGSGRCCRRSTPTTTGRPPGTCVTERDTGAGAGDDPIPRIC